MLTRPVPFRTDDAYAGFAEVRGQLTLEGEELVLEFQLKDSLFGAIKSGVKELRIPLDQLEDVIFRKGWLRRRLEIRTRSMAALGNLPGADGPRVVLKIARPDAPAARDLASHLLLLLSEERLRRLEDEARRG